MVNIKQRKAAVLFLDIETSPILGFSWGVYDTNILKVLEPSKIMCVSWKWLGSSKTQVNAISDYKGYKPGIVDDKALVKDVWELLDQADVVIAHNGISFDIKKLNARFIYHNLKMPSSYESLDTLKVARKYFKFDQNSLDSLGDYLNEGRKLSTGGFDLWDQCIKGNPKAWENMKAYNKGDVDLLEKIYMRFRPYMEHPNLNLITDNLTELSCPVCLSKTVTKRGYSYTKAGKKQRYQCNDCGSWSTGPWQSVKSALS